MKRWAILLVVGILLLFCTACTGPSSSIKKTGTYNGQTITMEYTLKTNVLFPQDMAYIRVINNYAVFYQYDSNNNQYDAWNALDLQGNILFDEPYRRLTHFNTQGQAAAQKDSNEYVLVNIKGEETPITETEYKKFEESITNSNKEEFATEIEKKESMNIVGYTYNGLAPYVQINDENAALLGLVDGAGNIVIPAYIPIHFITHSYQLSMYEDVIIIDDNGKIGFVTITRS